MKTNKILLIAGLDPSGNAGLIRDLEISYSFNLQPQAITTALTAQNKKKFLVSQIVASSIFKKQISSILPLSRFGAIKIGMLGNEQIVRTMGTLLKKTKRKPPIVLDPVFQSSTGGDLLTKKGRKELWNRLIPVVSLWTPNLAEAAYFSGEKVTTPKNMETVGDFLFAQKKVPVFIKGGHLKGQIQDLLITKNEKIWFSYPRRKVRGLRGTGCALSSLIAAFIASGFPLVEGVIQARKVMDQWIARYE